MVDVTSGSVSPGSVAAWGLGFLQTGEAVSITRNEDRDVLVGHGGAGDVSEIADVAASPLMTGRRFTSWFSGDKVAYYNTETVRGRYALRVAVFHSRRDVQSHEDPRAPEPGEDR